MHSHGTNGPSADRDGVRLPGWCPRCRAEYEGVMQFCPHDGAALRRLRGGHGTAGEVIGDRYLILREIDSGGMGRVYLAQHLRMGRCCAVKIMHRALLDDESAQARFNREAESASRINHPNVATIYDFGETTDGTAYLAMEYVPGESLRALVERDGVLSPLRASAIVGQIAGGLDAAHELPIVHRDLKPDNVMITRHRDGGDAVKLVDFGIAKSVAGDGGSVTALGSVVGTPDYMAPEQAAGRPVDARADVYALGLVAFHLLTASLAFAGETPSDRMLMRLSEPPRTLAQVRPEVAWPSSLQSVLDRALARDPAARYQSAGALGQDFAAAIADWQREPRRRPWRRTAAALRHVVVVLPTRVLRGGGDARAVFAGLAIAGLLGAATLAAVQRNGDVAPRDATAAASAVIAPDTAFTAAADTVSDAMGEVAPLPEPPIPSAREPESTARPDAPVVRQRRPRDAVATTHEVARAPDRPSSPAPDASAGLRRVEDAAAALRAMSGAARASAARSALADIDRLLPDLRSARDSVAALYAAAEVHLGVGDAATGCAILQRIREPARRTEFADGIDALLAGPVPICGRP